MSNVLDKNVNVVYGMYNLCEERELAKASFGYIMSDFADIKSRYIALGFHLDEFKRLGYYKDFGYLSFEDFCEKNIPLDKGSISRCICVFQQFAEYDGRVRKMWIDERWKDYSYSQLVEMVPLCSPVHKVIPSYLPVSKIRLVKKYAKRFNFFDSSAVEEIKRFIQDGCPEEVFEEVATSQPEEEEIDETPLYSSEQLNGSEFIGAMFGKIKDALEYLSLDVHSFKVSGKQLSFEDLDGNNYSILFMVHKNKGEKE